MKLINIFNNHLETCNNAIENNLTSKSISSDNYVCQCSHPMKLNTILIPYLELILHPNWVWSQLSIIIYKIGKSFRVCEFRQLTLSKCFIFYFVSMSSLSDEWGSNVSWEVEAAIINHRRQKVKVSSNIFVLQRTKIVLIMKPHHFNKIWQRPKMWWK